MEIVQIVPHLLQREAERRFHAVEAGRKTPSEERGPARAQKIR